MSATTHSRSAGAALYRATQEPDAAWPLVHMQRDMNMLRRREDVHAPYRPLPEQKTLDKNA